MDRPVNSRKSEGKEDVLPSVIFRAAGRESVRNLAMEDSLTNRGTKPRHDLNPDWMKSFTSLSAIIIFEKRTTTVGGNKI